MIRKIFEAFNGIYYINLMKFFVSLYIFMCAAREMSLQMDDETMEGDGDGRDDDSGGNDS